MATNRYNRDHCTAKVRAIITDKYGRTIQLLGKHAFEWSIVLEADGKVSINTYKSGKEASKELNNLKKKR